MYCRKCGNEIPEGSAYCNKCGAKIVDSRDEYKKSAQPESRAGTGKNRKKTVVRNVLLVILAVVFAAAAFGAAIYISFSKMTDKESPFKEREEIPGVTYTATPEPTFTPRPSPATRPSATPAQKATAAPTPVTTPKLVSNPELKQYRDPTFAFECSYPAHFAMYSDSDTSHRYTVREKNGTAYMIIGAQRGEVSIKESLAEFRAENGGELLSYDISDDDEYTAEAENDGMIVFRMLMTDDGKTAWFDFAYKKEYADVYRRYIDRLTDSFNFR